MTTLLREVPTSSPIHRLWAGTKIVAVVLVSIVVVAAPSWPAIGVVLGLLLLTAVIGRIPPTAVPRPPWWLWALILLGVTFVAIFGPGRPRILHPVLFVVLGWVGLIFLPRMIRENLP
ncbi:MAG: hypothetical protein ABS976_16905, partial [Rhodococcus sp. (in: high G+C Gram-positive bacteria)]